MDVPTDAVLLDPLEGPSSPSENPSSSSTSGSDTRPGADGNATTSIPLRTHRKPMPRKGHTKSRNGCYQCKRRKVKCSEGLPSCLHCQRIGLACEYPGMRYQRERNDATLASYSVGGGPAARQAGSGIVIIHDGSRIQRRSDSAGSGGRGTTTPTPMNALNASSPSFDMDDMRFYSHFIISAYPSLPIRGDQIWMNVSQMSYEYDFLMHSMLALGASHLTICTTANYSSQALSHRIKAIQSLNRMLSKQTFTNNEGDAAFATLLTLTFQSSYMPEGMLDFIAMVRGCHVVTRRAIPDMAQSAFSTFQQHEHVASFLECVNDRPVTLHDHDKMSALVGSIRALGPACKSVTEISYLADIQRVLQLCIDRDAEAYSQFTELYSRLGYMSNDDFSTFSNPDNHAAQVILAHFFLLDFLVGEAASTLQEMNVNVRKHVTLMWLEKVAAALPAHFAHHIECPLAMARFIITGTGPSLPGHWPKDPVRASMAAISYAGAGFSEPPAGGGAPATTSPVRDRSLDGSGGSLGSSGSSEDDILASRLGYSASGQQSTSVGAQFVS